MSTLDPFVVPSPPRDELPDIPSNPELVARIAAEIEAGGPMTFARFMELALYDPVEGYCSSPVDRPTRMGDFLTAPELDPLFGRALGRQIAEVWRRLDRPADFGVREYGAGGGALAAAILGGLSRDEPSLARTVRYEPIEHNTHRVRELRDRLELAGLGGAIAEPAGPFVGVVLANEFLDALPVHRVVGRADGALGELYVDVRDGQFVEVEGDPSTEALGARLVADGVALAPGQRAEVRLADEQWVAAVSRDLRAGVAIVVDYALRADELYAPSRQDGTLVAYLGHRAHTNPFRSVGRQDLTAHVDLTALSAAATTAGLDVLGETTQAEFLVGNGLEDLVEEIRADPSTDLPAWANVRAAVARLLDPRATGGFRVVVLGRGVGSTPPLAGLAFRLPRR
jgi:SAM-dependent MidA family methyltransferase